MKLFTHMLYSYDLLYRVYMRVYGWIAPQVVATTVFGLKVRCARADFIQRRIAFFGLFEPNLTYFIAAVLKPGDVFIDVGANIGYFTMLAAQRVGSAGKVYAIEAARSTYDLLVANLKLNDLDNVTPINMAVLDKACRVRIEPVESRNIGANAVRVATGSEADTVAARPLKDIVGSDLGRAAFIKVDIEGAEHLILPAIFDHFARSNTSTIIVSEIAQSNGHLVELGRSKGFSVRAMRNNYMINHLLLRSFLRLTGEGDFVTMHDVNTYLSDQYDYVFSR